MYVCMYRVGQESSGPYTETITIYCASLFASFYYQPYTSGDVQDGNHLVL
jgi:hypothetical protein